MSIPTRLTLAIATTLVLTCAPVHAEVLETATLRGDQIGLTLAITIDGLGLTRHEFSGTVDGDTIVGTVTLTPTAQRPMTLPWRATRTERSAYFAPTGTALPSSPTAR
jgi:hypothetical protein